VTSIRQDVMSLTSDAMNFIRPSKSQRPALWKALLVFKLVSGFLIAADQLSIRWGLDGSQRIVDDLLGGLIAGAIFHLYERHRLQRLSKQLNVIDLMNHHIRNALQPLMLGPSESGGKAHVKLVEDCVRRIDWALREVLPGKSEEQFEMQDGGGFVPKTGSSTPSCAPGSSETQKSAPESTTMQPSIPYSRWLNTGRSRNKKAS
jgi:hypothetical protein